MSEHDSPQDDKKLQKIRAQIDALDAEILNALERRTALAEEISAAKSGGHIFRAGREADLLRRLIKTSTLPPPLIERIWRQIIAGNLANQGGVNIALVNQPQARAAADFRFGAGGVLKAVDSHEAVVNSVSTGACHLGLVPHWHLDAGNHGAWLEALLKTHNTDAPVYITAMTPLLAGHDLDDMAILATILPDPSGADESVIMDGQNIRLDDGHHPHRDGFLGIIQKRDLS